MRERRVLVVDDEEGMLEVCQDTLERLDHVQVVAEGDSTRAIERLRGESFDVLVTDLRMPRTDGVGLLRIARETDPDLPVLMITGFPTVESAVETLRAGCVDYLVKPFLPDDLLAKVQRFLEVRRLRQENALLARHVARDFHGPDEPCPADVSAACAADAGVLITGGASAERARIAGAVHRGSRRAAGPFARVECGAFAPGALERELLGVEKGACPGASRRSIGLLDYAHGGTLFLDEVERLPAELQAALLRFLDDGRFLPLGGRTEGRADTRVIAGTATCGAPGTALLQRVAGVVIPLA